jgi:hypothetical protein
LLHEPGIHLEDGAEVHGADVVERARHELADDDAVGALRGVVRVPEHVLSTVAAQVGRCCAQAQPVVRALTTARLVGRREPVRRRVAHEVEVHAERVRRNERARAEARVQAVQRGRQRGVEEQRRPHQLRRALAVDAALREDRRSAAQRARAGHQHTTTAHGVQPLRPCTRGRLDLVGDRSCRNKALDI